MAGDDDRAELVKHLAGILANVAVITALLVFFGWTRISVQAAGLGMDESLFRVSTREYLLRSVRPVLVLLISVAVAGLLWVLLDRWLGGRLDRRGAVDPVARWALRLLPAAVVVLPAAVWVAGFVWPSAAYVAFPLSIAAGLLLVLYVVQVRSRLPGAAPLPASRETVVRGCAALLAGVCLFTAAANYATVEGHRLARDFVAELPEKPQVVVYSTQHLHIDAPGASEEALPAEESAYLFRYVGLRLLEHTGGQYFLVSDGWTPTYGVVIALPEDAPIRLEFVRDTRGAP